MCRFSAKEPHHTFSKDATSAWAPFWMSADDFQSNPRTDILIVCRHVSKVPISEAIHTTATAMSPILMFGAPLNPLQL